MCYHRMYLSQTEYRADLFFSDLKSEFSDFRFQKIQTSKFRLGKIQTLSLNFYLYKNSDFKSEFFQ